MGIGFKKSLFGFNCDDVVSYIESSHKSYVEKETVLNEKIEELDTSVKSLTAQMEEIKAAKAEVESQLKTYTDKYDEIERLSQNIGKLYLVSQTNSKAIMKTSQESAELSRKEIERNIATLDDAHESLSELKAKIISTSDNFIKQVEELLTSLDTTKGAIEQNNFDCIKNTENFESVYADITK